MNPRWRKYTGWLTFLVLLLMIGGCRAPAPDTAPPTATSGQSSPTESAAPPSSPSASTPSQPASPSPTQDDEATRLIRSMTLEQKVGQLLLAGVQGTKMSSAAKKMIAEDHVGGIILFKNNLSAGVGASAELLNGLKAANAGSPIPLFLSVDQEGGRVSRLPKAFAAMPSAAVVGSTGNAKLANEMGVLIARQLKLLGFNVDFAPVLDVSSNPKNPVIGDRSFGNTPKLVSEMGIAAMKGISDTGVVPVVKHFPGHGDTDVDSHLDLPVVGKSADQLAKMEWIPFRQAIDSGAEAVMVAHILFPEIDADAPASLSKVIIGEQLRGTFGFDGVVFTDDMTMGAIADHYGIADAAVRAIEAGGDIVLVAHGYDTAHEVYEALLNSVRSGRLTETRIDESVARILKLKIKYGLTDEAVPVPKESDIPNDDIRSWLKTVNNAG